jgi:tripartite-type tricarboxylate transporter receptor subunit TctC
MLVVAPGFAAKDVGELIALARAKPGTIAFASSGNGSAQHLAGELFRQRTGVDITHIPYKGGAPALQDLLGGHVPVVMSGLYTVSSAIKAGQIKALFVTSAQRSPLFPDLPTAQESGFVGFVADEWWGILAPKGTPPAIVSKINAEITRIFSQPDVKARIDKLGIEFIGSTPVQFGDFMQKESSKWSSVLKKAGVKPE